MTTRARISHNLIFITYVILSIFLCQFFASFIINLFPFSSANLREASFYLLYLLLEVLLIFILPAYIRKSPLSWSDLGFIGFPTFTDLGLAPVGFLLVYFLTNATTALFTSFSFFNPTEAQNTGFSTYLSGPEKLFSFIILCILVPIIEELIFRCIIYNRLKSTLRFRFGIFLAILLTSVIFATMHGQWNVAIMTFWLSIISCIFREITGTSYAGIILHILKNSIAFILLYVVII